MLAVVQCGHRDRAASDEHGLEHGERGDATRATDTHLDVFEHRVSLFGRELDGNGPTRGPRGEAQCLALREIVHLHHDAVDLVVEIVPTLDPLLAEIRYILQILDQTGFWVDGESEGAQVLERFVVTDECRSAHYFTKLVRPKRQLP